MGVAASIPELFNTGSFQSEICAASALCDPLVARAGNANGTFTPSPPSPPGECAPMQLHQHERPVQGARLHMPARAHIGTHMHSAGGQVALHHAFIVVPST